MTRESERGRQNVILWSLVGVVSALLLGVVIIIGVIWYQTGALDGILPPHASVQMEITVAAAAA